MKTVHMKTLSRYPDRRYGRMLTLASVFDRETNLSVFKYRGLTNDTAFMNAYPNLIYYLGVLDASPGQFTILRQTPGRSYATLNRGDPLSHLSPGD